MARRGENIYKRGDGRWEGRYIRGRTPEGRAQYGYVYAATYSACREKRRQCLRELPREITPSNNMTLPEAVDLFFAERERTLKKSTVSRYRYVVRQYRPTLYPPHCLCPVCPYRRRTAPHRRGR